jgi:hypothetical protein
MKNRTIEILSLVLVLATLLSGVLSLPELHVLPAEWLKYMPFLLGFIIAIKQFAYVVLDYLDDGLLNKSYKPPTFLPVLLLGLLCVVLIVQRSWLGALALVLATLAFALRLGASENYWDYLIDPYLALYSLGALLSAAVRWLLARPTRKLA